MQPGRPARYVGTPRAGPAGAAAVDGGAGGAGRGRGPRTGRRRPGAGHDEGQRRGDRVSIDPKVVDPRTSRPCRTWSSARSRTRPSKSPSSRRTGSGRWPAGWATWACRDSDLAFEGPVQDLIDELGKLPGIGPKSAQRIAFHLLSVEPPRHRPVDRGVGQGPRRGEVLRGVRQRLRRRSLPDLLGSPPRRIGGVRRRGAEGRAGRRAHARVPRPLPRAGRCAGSAVGCRTRTAANS